MNELPARRRLVIPGSCLRTSSHGQHRTAVERRHPRRLLASATPATDALRYCPGFPAMMYGVGQNVIVRMGKPARYALHTRRPRGPHSNRCHPPVIVSTAGAAAWLPHATPRDTCMTSGSGNPSSTCWHGWSSVLPPGQSLTTAPMAIIPTETHVVDTRYG